MGRKRVVVLGASGSIGKSTIDILRKFQDNFELVGFSVHSNLEIAKKIKNLFPEAVFYSTKENDYLYNINCKVLEKLIAETKPDIVVNGISGSQGLKASVTVLQAGVNLALANKETVVNGGNLVFSFAQKNNAEIIPVDSEHAAIFRLINSHGKENIKKIIITASGGPFVFKSEEELKYITVEDALKHPTWKMGGKITIDSATLANKGLEVIEAVYLFNVPVEKIAVTVHPQSIVHSMVQTVNGEVYAQMSPPDMRNPIFSALTFPELPPEYLKPLDFTENINLEFFPPRWDVFPLLKLGFQAAQKQAGYPLAFNCSNEEAVQAFINGKIGFTDIPTVVEHILNLDYSKPPLSFDDVYALEENTRKIARAYISKIAVK